jgi:hypothetical protein
MIIGPAIYARRQGGDYHVEADLLSVGNQRQAGVCGITVGVNQVSEHIWLVSFMHYDLGYFDDETCRLEPIDNPFKPSLLPMSSE